MFEWVKLRYFNLQIQKTIKAQHMTNRSNMNLRAFHAYLNIVYINYHYVATLKSDTAPYYPPTTLITQNWIIKDSHNSKKFNPSLQNKLQSCYK